MMADSLDDIFNSIYQSEQESNAQQEYFLQLKNKIIASEKEVEEAETKYSSMKENIAKRMKHLANREVELVSLNIRHKSLCERIKELNTENEGMKKTLGGLKVQLKSSREILCTESKKFIDEDVPFFSNKPQTSIFKSEAVSTKYPHAPAKTKDNSMEQMNDAILENEELWAFDIDFSKEISN